MNIFLCLQMTNYLNLNRYLFMPKGDTHTVMWNLSSGSNRKIRNISLFSDILKLITMK